MGMRVKVRSLGVTGEVMALHGRRGGAGHLREDGCGCRGGVGCGWRADDETTTTTTTKLGATGRSRASAGRAEDRQRVSSEVNLVGLRVDEALPKLDKALDNAMRGETTQVRVIHGFGTGALRRAVTEFLKDHPHVSNVNVASERPWRRHRRGAEGIDALPRQLRRRGPQNGRHRPLRLRARPAQEDGHLLEGPVPVPPGEDAVVQRQQRPRRLPLLRLRRGRRRVQVRDAARQGQLPGGDRDRGPTLRHPRAGEPLRAGAGPQGARRDVVAARRRRRALHAQPLVRAGHAGARVPAGPRLQEGDARAHPVRRGRGFLGRPLRGAQAPLPRRAR